MTARSAVDDAIEAMRRWEHLHGLIRPLGEQAASDAERRDEGGTSGPLHGVTVSVKDNIDLAGVPTTAGSVFLGDDPATVDATVTQQLRDAGAVFVGKANLAEWAMGATGRNRTFGDCGNPWDPSRVAGGSSGGSAIAVATGMSALSLGTDTGGSVRIPASMCGVTGLRPTHGRVSNRGVQPVGASFDTVGPMARDVRLVADALAAMDRYDAQDATSVDGPRGAVRPPHDPGIGDVRVGIPDNFFFDGVDPGVEAVVRAGVDELIRLGATPVRVTVPGAPDAQQYMTRILYAEAAEFHRERMAARPDDFDPDVLRRLRLSEDTSPAQVREARRWRSGFQHDLDALFDTVDVVVSPTVPVDVPYSADVDLAASTRDIGRFTYAWSMYGGPAISVPCGRHPESGMPVGLQLSCARWREDVLLHVAAAYQRATDWHDQLRPGA